MQYHINLDLVILGFHYISDIAVSDYKQQLGSAVVFMTANRIGHTGNKTKWPPLCTQHFQKCIISNENCSISIWNLFPGVSATKRQHWFIYSLYDLVVVSSRVIPITATWFLLNMPTMLSSSRQGRRVIQPLLQQPTGLVLIIPPVSPTMISSTANTVKLYHNKATGASNIDDKNWYSLDITVFFPK